MKIKLLLITCLALIACDNSNKEGSVYLRMQHEIDGDSLLTDTMLYVSPAISASRLYSVSVLAVLHQPCKPDQAEWKTG